MWRKLWLITAWTLVAAAPSPQYYVRESAGNAEQLGAFVTTDTLTQPLNHFVGNGGAASPVNIYTGTLIHSQSEKIDLPTPDSVEDDGRQYNVDADFDVNTAGDLGSQEIRFVTSLTDGGSILPPVSTGVSINDAKVSSIEPGTLVFSSSGLPDGDSGIAPVAASMSTVPIMTLGGLINDFSNEGTDSSQTLGSFLMSINGQNGVVVLPAADLDVSVEGQIIADTHDDTIDESVREAIDDALENDDVDDSVAFVLADEAAVTDDISAVTSIFDSGSAGSISEDSSDEEEESSTSTERTTTEIPDTLIQPALGDLMFTTGQWLGTFFGGLLDLGEVVTNAIKNSSLTTQSYW